MTIEKIEKIQKIENIDLLKEALCNLAVSMRDEINRVQDLTGYAVKSMDLMQFYTDEKRNATLQKVVLAFE